MVFYRDRRAVVHLRTSFSFNKVIKKLDCYCHFLTSFTQIASMTFSVERNSNLFCCLDHDSSIEKFSFYGIEKFWLFVRLFAGTELTGAAFAFLILPSFSRQVVN